MRWQLDTPRAVQAAAVLLRTRPHQRDNFMRLLKLLYLANREAIREIGRPIFTDQFVAMRRGPLPSGVYDLIKGARDDAEWSRHIARDEYDVELKADPGVGLLTKYEERLLQEVAERHRTMDEWELVDATHKLPEWIRNDPGDSSRVIPLADLLEAVGRQGDEEEIRSEMARRGRVSAFFGRKRSA